MAFEFVEKKKNKLLVCFSSRGRRKFDLYKNLNKIDEFDILFLSDEGDEFYNFSIPDFSTDLNDTLKKLKGYLDKYEYSVAIGSSMGGYAAILFGILCKFDKVVAIAPQITLNPKFAFTTMKECKHHCLRSILSENINTEVNVYFGNNVEDIIQTHKLEGCRLFYIDSCLVSFGHNILAELKECGQLDSFINDVIFREKSDLTSSFCLGLLNIELVEKFYDLFLDKNYKVASSYVPSVVRFIKSPHMMYMAILCYLSTDNDAGILEVMSEFPDKYKSCPSFYNLSIAVKIYSEGYGKHERLINDSNYKEIISILSLSKLMYRNILKIRLKAKSNFYLGARDSSSYYQIAMLFRALDERHDAVAYFLLANELADSSSWIKSASITHAKNLLDE